MNKIGLIIIDGQKDFCENGALPVTGGNKALSNISNMIKRCVNNIDELFLTFDIHHRHHISHSRMWINSKKEHPTPYTKITIEDIDNNIWTASNINWKSFQEDYIKKLNLRNIEREKLGLLKVEHTIWPDHCLIGTNGATIQDNLYNAMCYWEDIKNKPAQKISKGTQLFNESFSVFRTEVVDPFKSKIYINNIINELNKLDILVWGGLAKDYCVMNSFIDFIFILSQNNENLIKEITKKMVFLEDGTAEVGAVPELSQKFDEFLMKWNVTIERTDTFLISH